MANTPNFALYKPNRGDTTVEVDASLSDNFTKIDTELKNNKDGLDTHKNDPNAHTSENVSHADGSVKSTLENHEERIGDLETDADALEGRVNDIETLGLDVLAPTLEGRIQTIESDVEGFLAPATFDAMDQQSYTFDEYRVGYVNNKMADIVTTAKNSGAKLNGIDDDWNALQTFTDTLAAGTKVVFPPNSVFNISQPWMIRKGVEIDFNGSKLRYTGTGDLGTTNGWARYYGAITIEGSLDTTKQLSITAIEPNYYDTVQFKSFPITRITTSVADASTNFSMGDLVYIDAGNYATWLSWSTTYADNPAIVRCPAKIIKVSGADIFVDINPDYIFGGVNFNGTITKMNSVSHVTLENLFFEDAVETAVPSNPTNAQRQSWVAGISSQYADNLIIRNFEGSKHRFPAINLHTTYNVEIDNARFYNARAVSAGCGYGIQNNSCTHGNYSKLRGTGIRHLIDFSGGGHHYVEDARQGDYVVCAFDCHGMGEFDVTFNKCVGIFELGNGVGEFPEMVAGIKINNSIGSVWFNWVKDVTITNSELSFLEERRTNRVVNLNIQNSKIIGNESINAFYATSRGVYNDSRFSVSNSEIEIRNLTRTTSSNAFTLVGYDYVSFANNPRIVNKRNKNLSITLQKCKYAFINNNVIKDMGFDVQNNIAEAVETINGYMSMDLGSIQFINNTCVATANTTNMSFINLNDGGGVTKYKLFAHGNYYDAAGSTRWLRLGSNITGDIFITATSNTFVKNMVEASTGGYTPNKNKSATNNLEGYTGTYITA